MYMCWIDYEGYMWVYKVLWGVIYVLYLLCYAKGICELREGYLGRRCCIYGRNSVNVFYMGDGGECIKRVIKGVIILY